MANTELLSHETEGHKNKVIGTLLRDLSTFDQSLSTRINELEAGLSPNGEHPNGILSRILEDDKPEDHEAFVEEYDWALSLAIYPHRHKEDRPVLMSAAQDGLYMAGETYDPAKEPNFLKHLSMTVGVYLREVFGDAATHELPAADEFAAFVRPDLIPEVADPEPAKKPRRSYRPPVRHVRKLSTVAESVLNMNPQQRLAAYNAGRLSRTQLSIWASQLPEEVPVVNGEFEWIARSLADLD